MKKTTNTRASLIYFRKSQYSLRMNPTIILPTRVFIYGENEKITLIPKIGGKSRKQRNTTFTLFKCALCSLPYWMTTTAFDDGYLKLRSTRLMYCAVLYERYRLHIKSFLFLSVDQRWVRSHTYATEIRKD